MDSAPQTAPPETVQAFARRYLLSTSLSHKCAPGAIPRTWATDHHALDLRPGRPAQLRVTKNKPKTFKQGAMARKDARAQLHHKFWHHELQAAELFCWALLRFVDTPLSFRRGLLRIFKDEVRHMGLYQSHIESLGFSLTDFPVRDWFWERVPSCATPLSFVSLMGMGLEAANLEHTARFASWFRAVGDERAAQIQEQVGREEVAHVRFATRWFRHFSGGFDFHRWCDALPPPLTPLLLRGKTLHRERRLRAEFEEPFLAELATWQPDDSTSRRL